MNSSAKQLVDDWDDMSNTDLKLPNESKGLAFDKASKAKTMSVKKFKKEKNKRRDFDDD